jgi:hypothetical protein
MGRGRRLAWVFTLVVSVSGAVLSPARMAADCCHCVQDGAQPGFCDPTGTQCGSTGNTVCDPVTVGGACQGIVCVAATPTQTATATPTPTPPPTSRPQPVPVIGTRTSFAFGLTVVALVLVGVSALARRQRRPANR